MKRRALLGMGGAGALAMLSSCLGQSDVDAEYGTIASLAGGITGNWAGGSGADRTNSGRTGEPSPRPGSGADGGGRPADGSDDERDDGGLERGDDGSDRGDDGDDGTDPDDPADGGGDDGDRGGGSDPRPGSGDGVPGVRDADVRSVVGSGGIEQLTITHDRKSCVISFTSSSSDESGLMNDLEVILEALSGAITDERRFQSAVGRVVVDFEIDQPDGSGSSLVNPDWILEYRNGSLSMDALLERVRKNTRRESDERDL